LNTAVYDGVSYVFAVSMYFVSRNECVDIFVYAPIFVYTFCIYLCLFLVVFFTFSLLNLCRVRVDHLKKLQLPPVDYNCPYLASAGVGYHCWLSWCSWTQSNGA